MLDDSLRQTLREERRKAAGTKPTSDGRQIVSSLPTNRGV